MHEFVHQQNLMRYRKLLIETTNEARHQQLLKLLAEEEYEQKLTRQKKVACVSGLSPDFG